MLILQINKTFSTFYGNRGQIFCYKKRGVSIFYRNFVARMKAGTDNRQQTTDNRQQTPNRVQSSLLELPRCDLRSLMSVSE